MLSYPVDGTQNVNGNYQLAPKEAAGNLCLAAVKANLKFSPGQRPVADKPLYLSKIIKRQLSGTGRALLCKANEAH